VDHGRHEGNEPNMHPWCTEEVLRGLTASMDRGHREAPVVIVVGLWTGQEARALRQALRMTIPEFAERLGVAERTVAKWEAHGSGIVPVPVMQAALDTALTRASDEAKSRFGMLLAATRDGVQYEEPGAEVLAGPGAATRAAPASIPQRLDPEAIGRLLTILIEYVKIDNLLGPAHLLALMNLHLSFIGELLTVASGHVRTVYWF
jgi:transcriptional regulator with XRE-family HTH domain